MESNIKKIFDDQATPGYTLPSPQETQTSPLPPPTQQTVFPVRMAGANTQFADSCFRHLPYGEELRSALAKVLRTEWWLNDQPAPAKALDRFVEVLGEKRQCLLCMQLHDDNDAALKCVRAHIP